MFSISIAVLTLVSSINAASHLPVNFEYAHQSRTEDGLRLTGWLPEAMVTSGPISDPGRVRFTSADGWSDNTCWLPGVVVTAEPIRPLTPSVTRTAVQDGWSDNTYWLPEVVVTAEPIEERGSVPASAPAPPAVNRFASAAVAVALALFSVLLGFGLLARPQAASCPRLQPVAFKRLKPNRRRPIVRPRG